MKYELIVTRFVWDEKLRERVRKEISRRTIVLVKKGRYLVEDGVKSLPLSFEAKTLKATQKTQDGQYHYELGEKKE